MPTQTPIYHSDVQEVASELKTDISKGLTADDASRRLEEYGRNATAQSKRAHPFIILLNQLKSPVVYLLLVAAGLSFFFKEYADAIAILIVIVVNTAIGFIMEWQAARSMEALSQMTKQNAKVMRDGKPREIDSEEMVPGDIILVEAGDMVPADGRIVESTQLQADESALTGESVPVEKENKALEGEVALAERVNMLFKGTYIRMGNAKLLCTGTGMETELGAIASMVQSAKKSATPLEKKLEGFSKRLMGITVVIVALIFLAGILNKVPVREMLQTSIALAVAAIPEGLPIVATLALARGMLRMARQNVIVKKLSAVETLGSTTVICTDKTGTLTENRMDVTAIDLPPGNTIETGKVEEALQRSDGYQWLLKIAVLCNNASLDEAREDNKGIGDPLEISLLQFALESGADGGWQEQYKREKELPFSSELKIMATLHQYENGYLVAAKGASENLLACCTGILDNGEVKALTEEERNKWLERTDALAGRGLKPLAFAMRQADGQPEQLEKELVFVGLAGFLDPPRPDVKQAIQECHDAHIQVVMITGDHPATAGNIAQQLQITKEEDKLVMGKDMKALEALGAEDKAHWRTANVFARVSPRQKLDLVTVHQENKDIVAMTGDGVNDAPALKKADIGIAMGIRGTQVTQEVADMILKDDAFSSIVEAIRQGRVIFENIRSFIIYLLSCNLSELLVIGICAALNLPFQLFALQILFINLITDVLPAMALGVAEGNDQVMKKKPKDPAKPLIDRKRWISIWVYAAIIGGASLGAALLGAQEGESREATNNVLFFTLIFCQLLHVFNMAATSSPFFTSEIFRNKYVWLALIVSLGITLITLAIPALQHALKVENMSRFDWYLSVGFSLGSVILVRLLKKLHVIE
ncbi:cation-translocating P-type ATPase [Filimonas effusa]|uniref:Cation-translocating P-type ATPase n=1 Tax=Filimonas effusa TaxID=2508721 RepID=A0A4Q1DAN8_9BACT|nr:cation-translocating P-type ATPase [Filimonas effusa]RXK86484.1 cation-translocating P-type ATPase [Filimonas effusa]